MRVHASILVQRPIAAVFACLSTPDHLPGWVTRLARADGPPRDELEVGATLILQRAAALGHARSTWEVIAYEPSRSLARLVLRPLAFRNTSIQSSRAWQ